MKKTTLDKYNNMIKKVFQSEKTCDENLIEIIIDDCMKDEANIVKWDTYFDDESESEFKIGFHS